MTPREQQQLMLRVGELERLVKQLLQPKSVARLIIPDASNSAIFQATSGIAARSGTTITYATCARQTVASGNIASASSTDSVGNFGLKAIATNAYIIAHEIDSKWITNSAIAIIDIRVSGTTLQYTVDGSTWVTWHTGTTCE